MSATISQSRHSGSVQQYHDEGYCIIRGLLSPGEVQSVLGRLEMAVTRQLDPKIYVQIEPGHEKEPPDMANPWKHIRKTAGVVRHDSFFRDLVAKEKFISIARRLLMSDDFRCFGDEAQLKPPRVGSAHPWHQDQPYFSGLMAHIATCWVALDAATKANGCMQVLPGSHRNGIIPRQNPGQAFFADGEIDTSHAVYAEMEPGDALWFHSLTAHGSDRNETDKPRRSFIFRYINVDGLPKEHWEFVRKHGVIDDERPNASMIYRPEPGN